MVYMIYKKNNDYFFCFSTNKDLASFMLYDFGMEYTKINALSSRAFPLQFKQFWWDRLRDKNISDKEKKYIDTIRSLLNDEKGLSLNLIDDVLDILGDDYDIRRLNDDEYAMNIRYLDDINNPIASIVYSDIDELRILLTKIYLIYFDKYEPKFSLVEEYKLYQEQLIIATEFQFIETLDEAYQLIKRFQEISDLIDYPLYLDLLK